MLIVFMLISNKLIVRIGPILCYRFFSSNDTTVPISPEKCVNWLTNKCKSILLTNFYNIVTGHIITLQSGFNKLLNVC